MICEKHVIDMHLICDEWVCGACYGEKLLTEPIPKPSNFPPIDMSKGLFGRNEHYRGPENT